MPKRLFFIAMLAAAPAASGQGLDPGQWEFTSTTTSPMLPKPQTSTVKHCVKPEDANNPERWMGQQNQQTDCKFTHGPKGGGTMTWEMSCPKSGMRGNGTARIARGSMESEMNLAGEMQGRKFQMRTKMSGRRLGACKS